MLTEFLGHIARGEAIKLVDGGSQRRSFTYVSDDIDALTRVIRNVDGKATSSICNIGNPDNDLSIRELADLMLKQPESTRNTGNQPRGSNCSKPVRRNITARAARTRVP